MKTLLTFSVPILLFIACDTQVQKEEQKEQEKTMTGIVQSIIYGKDGYTADMTSLKGEPFKAVISIINVGGPQNYQALKPKDEAILTGEYSLTEGEGRLIVTKIDAVVSHTPSLFITKTDFMGISLGDNIADHANTLTKGILKDGEGTFNVYWIKDDANKDLGYCLLHSKENPTIQQIFITSPAAKTETELHIGTTFRQLIKAYPNLEVHGSEIEGRTYASNNNGISYRIDAANFSYEVDMKAIPETAKVIEIMIK